MCDMYLFSFAKNIHVYVTRPGICMFWGLCCLRGSLNSCGILEDLFDMTILCTEGRVTYMDGTITWRRFEYIKFMF